MPVYFTPELFRFLTRLKRKNDRDWFLAHKEDYETCARQPAIQFITDFGGPLYDITPHLVADPRGTRGSLFRIYRDTRFSSDKRPYKTHLAMRFSHRGKFWQFEDIIVEPPTAQKPHPPMWMGAGSPDSIRQVAERGYNLLLDQFASFDAVAERIAVFKAEVEKRGRTFDPMEVGVARAYFVAKDEADKQAALERRLEAQRRLAAVSSARSCLLSS